MPLKHVEEYRDSALTGPLIEQLNQISSDPIRIMEVCGTHTMSIFKHGIRSVLPKSLTLLSGPGCPVCVTSQQDIDAFISFAQHQDVIVTTFGDLMRVPGSHSTLSRQKADGHDIRMVYSTFDALEIAQKNPDRKVVFLGVGFETTAPTVAAAVHMAKSLNIDNFWVYCAHKLVPPALEFLSQNPAIAVDGFLLPGHVSVIIGKNAYPPVLDKHKMPGVIAGFEPADILLGLLHLAKQIKNQTPQVENAYPRAVTDKGNQKALKILRQVFVPSDAAWRGIGVIENSGLCLSPDYEAYDARHFFDIPQIESKEPKGCACGEILMGVKTPPECPLFRKKCTPMDPIGPCMVSSEGTCAAYYKYNDT